MKILIISDMFSLDSWLIDGNSPEIMPAVYEFFNYLGNHKEHTFDAVIAHPKINKVVNFPNGSKIHIHRLNVPFHYVRKFVSTIFLKNKATTLLNRNKDYDIVYGMTIYANVAREIGKSNNILSVGRLFGSLIWDVLQRGKWLNARTRFYYQFREIKKPCDITICTEDGTQFDLAINKYSPGVVLHMLYNGVNEKLREQLLSLTPVTKINSNEQIRFCYIARLTSWKRQDLALEIIVKLKDRNLNISLDIYGRGETYNYLVNRINELGIANEVSIKGSIAHKDIPELLSKYQVAFFLYDASNLGNSLWEAALAGKFIFTRNTGKTSIIFNKNNSVVVSDIDIDSAVTEFIDLLDRDIEHTQKSRSTVDNILPTWKDRIENEIEIIQDNLFS